jgi:hypothetical protein
MDYGDAHVFMIWTMGTPMFLCVTAKKEKMILINYAS